MNECLEWPECSDTGGRGMARYQGKLRIAARVFWELIHGPIPEGMCVCHHCDNPACVNPGHLFIGTKGDNTRDAASKGRVAGQKLSHLGAIGVMSRCLQGVPQKDIAVEFGVSTSLVSKIYNLDAQFGRLFSGERIGV